MGCVHEARHGIGDGAFARFLAGPTDAHWRAALAVVRYLERTAEDGITFGGSEEALVGY